MKYSIIIPLYNKECGILRSLESVLNQSYSDFELIVVNDGSTDGSVNVVNTISDSRLALFNQENGGPSSARNNGISRARGEWILFLDADDELLPNALETFDTLVIKYPSISVFCCNHMLECDGKTWVRAGYYPDGIISDNYRAWFFNILLPCQGSTLFRKEVLLKKQFPEHLRRWEDAALMFEIMREFEIVRCHVPTFIYHRSMSEGMYARKNVMEDYGAFLVFERKSLWERLCLFRLYKQTKELYPRYNIKYKYDSLSAIFIPILYNMIMTAFNALSKIKTIIKD